MSVPKRRAFTLILGLAVVLALLLPSLRPHPTPRYAVTDLGVLPGDTESRASGINNHGDVVGFSSKDFDTAQMFLVRRGRMTSAGPTKSFSGAAINDSGHINQRQRIGSAAGPAGYQQSLPHHAVLYSGSQKIDFTLPPGWRLAVLDGVNGRGQVVGICWRQTLVLGSHSRGAFIYDSKTRKASLLPLPPGCLNAEVNGINDHDQMTGYTWQGGYSSRAVLWNAGKPVLLTGLPGRDISSGSAINNRGEVVGSAGSEPNAAGQLVSSHNIRLRLFVPFFRRQWEDHAVLYKGGQAQDLNTLIPEDADWTLEEANSINDRGQIVGEGLHHGQQRAFLLTPVR